MDSAVVLAIARSEGFGCEALSFDYGQRHRYELDSARRVADSLGAHGHTLLPIDMRAIGGSALTDDIEVPKDRSDIGEGIPVTYVPARNTVFLSYALALAEVKGAWDIFIGENALDYSGYPDCRPDYLEAFQTLANLSSKVGREGHGPLLWAPLVEWSKQRIVEEALRLGVPIESTWSCYSGGNRPCSVCDSCRIRDAALRDAGRPDLCSSEDQ